MSERHQTAGLTALALIVCCVGLPVLAAASVSVALAAWIGGSAAAVIALGLVRS